MPEEVLQSPGTRADPESAELARLTKIQKLAALLVMLGPDSAAAILKSFEPAEVETITSEMARLPMISQTLQQHLLAEFSDVALEASTSLAGGLDFARATLEKALGVFRATEIINRIAPSRGSVAAIQGLADMEPRQIYNLLRHEQPQTIALFLSFVPPDKAAAVFALLPPEARERVLERLATLSPTPVEVVEKVIAVLNTRLGVRQTRALNQTGGVKTAADILNAMEKTSGKSLLLSIEEHNPELCQAIRQKMFTFEDLASLETPTLQRILREVDMRDLAMALKTASDKVKATLLACISKRAAETVQEEITYMGPVRLRDIENAQLRVIDAVRKLEADGDIELGNSRPNALHEVV
ncbi:MAG: flagellar motor switch protein FliG [Verrucomicrobiales bacterium]|nr:flagellar motor switch protein FliG [Verrucomicrobiales bacterium]